MVAEIAIALMLLAASGLLLRSFEKMRAVDLGFQPDHVPSPLMRCRRNNTRPRRRSMPSTTIVAPLAADPGVNAVGMTNMLPASGGGGSETFVVEGYVPPGARS